MAYNEKHLVKLADLKALGTKQKRGRRCSGGAC